MQLFPNNSFLRGWYEQDYVFLNNHICYPESFAEPSTVAPPLKLKMQEHVRENV